MVMVTPKSPIDKNQTIRVKIKASTKVPYQKEISCEVVLRVQQETVNTYTIDDVANRNYAVLKVVNAQDSGNPVTIEFDSDVVRVDLADDSYVNRVAGSEVTDSKGYVKKYTFNMNKESTQYIKFYKVDMSKDYTYPSGDANAVVNVTNK